MTDFLQLHLLTAYGPSNLNRDDTGRPKSVFFGGTPRLRVSSQSLKRAWRTSEVFANTLGERLGKRTRRLGAELHNYLLEHGMEEDKALEIARKITDVFGKLSQEKNAVAAHVETLYFVGPDEIEAAYGLAKQALAGEEIAPMVEDVLRVGAGADIAMFGRMLTSDSADDRQRKRKQGLNVQERGRFTVEAAVQVAHAITTHRGVAEDDYFTAVDELLKGRIDEDDMGAGHVSVQEFGAGVFYLYVCINRDLLLRNLDQNRAVRDASLAALVEAASTVAPVGKQASFASRARAFYVLGEKGSAQPRSLAAAFLKPITGNDQGTQSITALEDFRDRLDAAYGPCADERCAMNVAAGEGTLRDLITFSTS